MHYYYTSDIIKISELSAQTSSGVVGPRAGPIQWVPGALSLGVKWSGYKADHSPTSSAEVENVWRYISTPQYALMAWCSVKKVYCLLYFTLWFYFVKGFWNTTSY